MVSAQSPIDLHCESNEILLNPRWPETDYQALYRLAEKSQSEKNLKSHVWIATSGSTANSISATKLVALSKQALMASARAVNLHLQSSAKDVWTQVLPHFHVGGLGIEIRAHLSGAKVVNALKDGRWDVQHFYDVLVSEGCTLSALVPTQVYDLVSHGLKAPATLRAIVVGGGAFEADLYKKARALGWPVLPSYGMSETASQIATASLDSLKQDEFPPVGLLTHAKARQNDGGYLEVWAESLFTCYAQNTETGSRVWDPKTADGWFTTEDKGSVVHDSLLIEGRSKDYVKIGGEATNVARLRSVLESCALHLNPHWPTQVTLLDVPSDRLGAEIHLVSLLSEADTDKVLKLYSEKVLPFEKARKIYYMNEIPRSDLGKILWAELRRKL
ncbi:AMP-binding protein [Bdellovibrio bacteriovorus]|uniref:MenE, O-succinylbenzoate-CoA ligase n=1 Tax=Bdellovibrio bacteriovorus str. Tiberius TaxID=1069642 RepID=K7YKH8_BDEBC|nr:AMP-binding protein [Bdellovibrio bacteriovorus]AFY00236.1 menE, O-succinylbenzoate-CoA ligase [Bdellovibrio bacteriovorus str. Tiberius]